MLGQQGEESHQEHQAGHRKEDVAPDEERVHYLTGEEREMLVHLMSTRCHERASV